MKKNQQDKPLLKFSSPDPVTSRIFVSKVLPDNSLEPIGIVFPCFSNEDGCVYYYSSDMNCDNIGSYTSDFNEVEKEFEKYAEKLAGNLFIEEMTAKASIYICEAKLDVCSNYLMINTISLIS